MSDAEPAEPVAPEGEHPEPVVVAGFADVGEAEVAQAKLRAYGIESVLVDHVEGGLIMAGDDVAVGVEVKAADAADARELLGPDPGDEGFEDG